MFLYCTNAENLAAPERLRESASPWGQVQVLNLRHGCIVWIDTGFCISDETADHARIEMRLPVNAEGSANRFDWDGNRRQVRFARSWSGVFAMYFSDRSPFIVTSHRKLASLFLKRSPPLRTLKAGSSGILSLDPPSKLHIADAPKPSAPSLRDRSFRGIASQAKFALTESMQSKCADGMALLLSGGVDSTILAAVAKILGFKLETFTFALRDPLLPDSGPGSDRANAAAASAYFGHTHHTVLIERKDLIDDLPAALYLAETSRGTIADELPAHIAMSRYLHRRGIRQVLTGGCADDLFGAFPFALRYYRGPQLRSFLQSGLRFALPDELAMLQNIYSYWGISLVHPYWSEDLRSIGHWLPLGYRVDKQRRMKTVLRSAFADIVPEQFVMRPKGVPRDCAQIRQVLAAAFGDSPNRYRPLLSKMMERGSEWPERQLPTLRNR